MPRVDVVGIGYATLDYLLKVPRLASVPGGCRLLNWDVQGGGVAATAMVTVARLGARAGMITAVGDDSTGEEIIRGLEKERVDVSRIRVVKGARSMVVFVLVDGETWERVFLPYMEIEDLELSGEDLKYLAEARIVHADTAFPKATLSAFREARRHGVVTSLDIGLWRRERTGILRRIISLTDVLICSETAALEATGETDPLKAARVMTSWGPSVVGVTLGERGSLCVTREGEEVYHEGFKVPVEDTTGAGDVYHGAFLYGLLKKWPLSRIVVFANAVAAIKCTRLGGRAGIPNLEEATRFIKAASLQG